MTSLADVVAALERWYPLDTAQSWDQVGLVSGDPSQPVRLIHLAVDPTQAVIDEAIDAGADLLITHHPLLLRGVHGIPSTTAKGSAVRALVRADVALYVAHTNADVAAGGVGDALAEALGLADTVPLTIEEGQPLGRVGSLPEPMAFGAFVRHVAWALPAAPAGLRASGDPHASVSRIAVSGGAGDSLFGAAREAGADVFVTADLRHHPVLEDRETSRGGRPFIIDAGHWASEFPWLRLVEHALGQDPALVADDGTRLVTYVSTICTDPWSFTVGALDPEDVTS